MIQLKVSTAQGRNTYVIDESKTLRDIVNEYDIITDGATLSLDGVPLTVQEMGMTFTELSVAEACTLSVVVKTGNA